MLTNDKKVCGPEYWNDFYSGKNNTGQDNSNTIRPPSTFDRFELVLKHIEGDVILDIGSGHARICKMIKARWSGKIVIASDQSPKARDAANFEPFVITSGYHIPFPNKFFSTLICTQTLTLMDDPDKFLEEAKRVGKKIIITIANGEDRLWSQVHAYNETTLSELLSRYGKVELMELHFGLLLAKLKFDD